MKEILAALVVILIALPFLYMVYDVTVDLLNNFYKTYIIKAKPVMISIVSLFIE